MINPGLRTSLKMLIVFLLITVVGTLLCSFLFMLYSICCHLVAGESLSLFSISLFMQGISIMFPLCITITSVLLVLYLIRHPSDFLFSFITYVFIGLLCWLLLLPVSINIYKRCGQLFPEEQEVNIPSERYFRHSRNQIILFTSIDDQLIADGVCIDLTNKDQSVFSFTDIPVKKNTGRFSDSLIEESLNLPGFAAFAFVQMDAILKAAVNSFMAGYLDWLCFATMGLAFLSILGLHKISTWRFMNAFAIFLAVIGVFEVNAVYYSEPVFRKAVSVFETWISFIPNPFLFIVNILIALIFSVTGIVFYFVRRPKNEPKPKVSRVKKNSGRSKQR